MNPAKPRIIELTEYKLKSFQRHEIPESVAIKLYQNYRKQVQVEFPNYKTDGKWQLKAQGWVGYIPVTPVFCLALRPKVQLSNIFGMLEYAYKLKINFIEGLIECQ